VRDTLLAVVIVGAVYAWSRVGFRVPGFLRVPARVPRTVVLLGGWAVIVLVSGYSLGDAIGGHTQIAKSPTVRYAIREREPGVFWRQIALQTVVGLLFGSALVGLARARPQSSVAQ
jgi:hypothetical protein